MWKKPSINQMPMILNNQDGVLHGSSQRAVPLAHQTPAGAADAADGRLLLAGPGRGRGAQGRSPGTGSRHGHRRAGLVQGRTLGLGQVRRAAAGYPADRHGGAAKGDPGAERPEPAPGAVQRLRHHLQRRRRRRRFRRQHQHPRLQRQRQHAGGRAARQRPDQPQRPVQPGGGGSDQGTELGVRRRRHQRRQHQHGQQAAQGRSLHPPGRRAGHGPLPAPDPGHQPAAGRARRVDRLPPQPHGPPQRCRRARTDRQAALGHRAIPDLRPGHPDPPDPELLPPTRRQPSRLWRAGAERAQAGRRQPPRLFRLAQPGRGADRQRRRHPQARTRFQRRLPVAEPHPLFPPASGHGDLRLPRQPEGPAAGALPAGGTASLRARFEDADVDQPDQPHRPLRHLRPGAYADRRLRAVPRDLRPHHLLLQPGQVLPGHRLRPAQPAGLLERPHRQARQRAQPDRTGGQGAVRLRHHRPGRALGPQPGPATTGSTAPRGARPQASRRCAPTVPTAS